MEQYQLEQSERDESIGIKFKETDQCVLCGLCIPHCPTYHLTQNEADSPRGRISLIQALGNGKLLADEHLRRHLDRCLVCRNCEKVCPSRVPYGELIDSARSYLDSTDQHHPPHETTLAQLLDTVVEKSRLKKTAKAIRLYQQSGAQWLARKSGILKGLNLDGLEQLLPNVPDNSPLLPLYPAAGKKVGSVALFTGCIGEVMDSGVIPASVNLLTRIGFDVLIPQEQVCCGSLHHHNGKMEGAKQLANKNSSVFSTLKLDAVIGTASGCSAHLHEYADHYGEESSLPAIYDICDFLAAIEWPDHLKFKSLEKRIALHEPCSSRNQLNAMKSVEQLLSKIPGAEFDYLENNQRCCGAAGSYMVTQPEFASSLRSEKQQAIKKLDCDLLLTTNIGCSLHMQAGLDEKYEIKHPIEIIDQLLINTD